MISLNDIQLDKSVTKRYVSLPQPCNQVQVMYVWIDGTDERMRCKTRTMDAVPTRPTDCAVWTFDGSKTGQADSVANADVLLYPCAIFNDPFRRGQNKLVLCETYNCNKKPSATNFRSSCRKVAEQVKEGRPWFGMEQQYVLFGLDGRPFGCPRNSFPDEQNSCYCGVGANTAVGRDVLESLYRACMYSGVKMAGCNEEVMPSQWEFQIGPCEGIEIGDHLWMARFLLQRIAEDYGVVVSFEPKPLPGNWEGSKLYTDFSTMKTRQDGGLREIEKMVEKLRLNHCKHLLVYGNLRDTDRRPPSVVGTPSPQGSIASTTGQSVQEFSHGVANRAASVRIPRLVADEGKGHLQDRRPPSNADPYRVAECILRTVGTPAPSAPCENIMSSFEKLDSIQA